MAITTANIGLCQKSNEHCEESEDDLAIRAAGGDVQTQPLTGLSHFLWRFTGNSCIVWFEDGLFQGRVITERDKIA
jgi:hypothetical protein